MAEQEKNTQTELSSRTAAFFSWIEILGILAFVIAGLTLGRDHWLRLAALLLVASGYVYRIYAAWKAGNKRAFWTRILLLLLLVAVALYFGYSAGQKL